MQIATLEHVNITVKNPKKTAALLHKLFGWIVRWEGPSLGEGYTVHIGDADRYLALYNPGKSESSALKQFQTRGGLNHIGLVVEDLDAVEKRVVAAGLVPKSHSDYEPGRRFYFSDEDGVEYEVVSYLSQKEAFKRQLSRERGRMARFGALAK